MKYLVEVSGLDSGNIYAIFHSIPVDNIAYMTSTNLEAKNRGFNTVVVLKNPSISILVYDTFDSVREQYKRAADETLNYNNDLEDDND